MSDFPELQPLKTGDTLWYVPENRRMAGFGGEQREFTVTKVGRVWATVADPRKTVERVHTENLRADGKGYASPGQCYRSREHYEEWQATSEAWGDLLRALERKYYPPAGMTARRIRLALGLLRMGGDTDPLAVVQKLLARLPDEEAALSWSDTHHAREELATVRRLFGTPEPAKPVSGASKS